MAADNATCGTCGFDRAVCQGNHSPDPLPRPPAQRGWVPTTGTPIQDAIRARQIEFLARAMDTACARAQLAWIDTPPTHAHLAAVDRTFENETRLHR